LTNSSSIVLYETEYLRLKSILAKTQRELGIDLILLIDRDGHQIASEGPARDIDLTALASLAAANLAATDGLARLVGEPDFSILYHQGKHRNIHISDVARRYCLILVFDEKVSLGLVRLRVKHTTAYLEEVFKLFARKLETKKASGPEAVASPLNFTDEDIDKLFGR
jgi:predicted regulator of Ras-like GTPase activity (Roadblock/LC7/MglB family)